MDVWIQDYTSIGLIVFNRIHTYVNNNSLEITLFGPFNTHALGVRVLCIFDPHDTLKFVSVFLHLQAVIHKKTGEDWIYNVDDSIEAHKVREIGDIFFNPRSKATQFVKKYAMSQLSPKISKPAEK